MLAIDAPRIEPIGPWVEVIIATPSGTFQWPPEPYGWGSVVVKCKSTAKKDQQKAAGGKKATTKKSGPEPIPVTLEFRWVRRAWDGPQGMGALLGAIDPNNENGNGGPFDFQAADFTRRGGKSIDVDEVGEVVWQGHIGTCTVTAHEWVEKPVKASGTQGTTTPQKSAEYVPGDEGSFNAIRAQLDALAAAGFSPPIQEFDDYVSITRAQNEQSKETIRARPVAERGFDGPENPEVKP